MNATVQIPIYLQIIIFAWSLIWRGLALWNAAKNGQKNWFIALLITNTALLIINTVGILEIIYLFKFAKKKMTISDLKFWESKK
jgi:hypothetical protein